MKVYRGIFLVVFFLAAMKDVCHSQKLIKGIVADSASLDGLPGVHIQVKHSKHATVSDANGIFTVMVRGTDSVTFSFVGYTTITVPVDREEELMFVRLHDNSILLQEIIVRPSFFDKEYVAPPRVESPALRSTKPLRAASGGINFSYFTKQEKEKRKLVKVLDELDRARVYIDIVNDPELKKEIMDQYMVTESGYYDLLAAFNERNTAIMHCGSPTVILVALDSYFKTVLKPR
ncbi:MAG TPA: carboxypeptidase-like regulatory domain-containing protein [Cyclobacteriaceae bacterium]|nr:carboxypeptidase-like regulatory domain-containing protein [Cyclobacteriaceae bacterium]